MRDIQTRFPARLRGERAPVTVITADGFRPCPPSQGRADP